MRAATLGTTDILLSLIYNAVFALQHVCFTASLWPIIFPSFFVNTTALRVAVLFQSAIYSFESISFPISSLNLFSTPKFLLCPQVSSAQRTRFASSAPTFTAATKTAMRTRPPPAWVARARVPVAACTLHLFRHPFLYFSYPPNPLYTPTPPLRDYRALVDGRRWPPRQPFQSRPASTSPALPASTVSDVSVNGQLLCPPPCGPTCLPALTRVASTMKRTFSLSNRAQLEVMSMVGPMTSRPRLTALPSPLMRHASHPLCFPLTAGSRPQNLYRRGSGACRAARAGGVLLQAQQRGAGASSAQKPVPCHGNLVLY
jgi:hypothetical protein